MYSKMAQSQSTIISNFKDTRVVPYNARDEQTTLKNPYNQTLPMKFPKNAIRKPTSQHILHETVYSDHNKASNRNHIVSVSMDKPTAAVISKISRLNYLKVNYTLAILSSISITSIHANYQVLELSNT